MAIRTELSLRLANSPGALAHVCQLLGEAKIGIAALSLNGTGTLRLVVDNPQPAIGVLNEHRYAVEERDVLFAQLPEGPGAVARVSELVADVGVNPQYAYSGARKGLHGATMVVGVDDALKASTVSRI